jgi:ATP-dependent protease ClpP protease subunit
MSTFFAAALGGGLRIDGIAASIASMIAMAGNEVVMPENAMLVLHDPSGLVAGTASDMRAMAQALDRMKAGMVAAYRDKSGREDAEIEALMAAETWLSAQEAIALGLADRVEERPRLRLGQHARGRAGGGEPAHG